MAQRLVYQGLISDFAAGLVRLCHEVVDDVFVQSDRNALSQGTPAAVGERGRVCLSKNRMSS
jgi:hypothetical protein